MGCASSAELAVCGRKRQCAECRQALKPQDERLCCACHGKMWMQRRRMSGELSCDASTSASISSSSLDSLDAHPQKDLSGV
eukprot:CAMPEP_0115694426 /NCGR_PEP_ID=MMETSP0272-20121206/64239_1 /TAXON_ID=71861 /ORGANISM="Scrippsiella trochoidea, Strain CCMP3099" /LENGTH=80 /DNA_ID=CAMNT_0003134583 /DNA_START=72 /DNA_END=314 /DNA_ORIENTATION=+